jgi:hypothetical protein
VNRHLNEYEFEEYLPEASRPHDPEIAAHLAACASCRQILKDQKNAHQLLKQLRPVTVSPDLKFKVMSKIEALSNRIPDRIPIGLIILILVFAGFSFIYLSSALYQEFVNENPASNKLVGLFESLISIIKSKLLLLASWLESVVRLLEVPLKSGLLIMLSALVFIFYYFVDQLISRKL